ncbi:hypothetical protein FB381_0075 [Nocardioides albertanoniae]|uniref:Subtilisin inhibitor-like n=1 Tax=Nocardioides albertanoniae TaxID=1175486 RepID=A0A543A157_9ACTN|nr:hypothetical protein [Nocardioides albertanoniae]TQL66226.1 hypothetical protein FB381_0075 [Nocardioides albertanoniae]
MNRTAQSLTTVVVIALATALTTGCGGEEKNDSSGETAAPAKPIPADAETLILETAELLLSKPDFPAACKNISESRRPDNCAEDVRAMVQEHMMDEGLPFDADDIGGPREGLSECILEYGDGTMPLFGSVTVIFTERGWEIDDIDSLITLKGNAASPAEYECPA